MEICTFSKQVNFHFSFPMRTRADLYHLNVPLEIPFTDSISELVQRLAISLKLPPYVEEGMYYKYPLEIYT